MLLLRYFKKTLFSVFFIAFIPSAAAALSLDTSCPANDIIQSDRVKLGRVKWIADGDTLHLQSGEKIRLLNINTPELHPKHSKQPEAYAELAKQKLSQLIGPSNQVFWELDQKTHDRYGRILAHVFNQQGRLLSADLLQEGLASMLVVPPNDRYWQCLKRIELKARQQAKGIWSLALFQFQPASQVKPQSVLQRIVGKVTRIENDGRYQRWQLDERLWIMVDKKRLQFFNEQTEDWVIGDELAINGYVKKHKQELQLMLKHPAQWYPNHSPQKAILNQQDNSVLRDQFNDKKRNIIDETIIH